jgi:HAD superfamily hydrolase (TIGR01549 family)
MLAATMLWGFGQSLFWYLQPLYVASLGATPAQIGLVLGGGGLVVTLLYIPIGLWADRRGRKPVILAGWAVGALATYAMAAAPDWRWLLPGVAAYLLSSFAMPAFYAYVAASEQEGALDRLFAILAGASALGSIVAPAVGGWIGFHYGLRMVYLTAAVVFTLSCFIIWSISSQPASSRTAAGGARRLLRHRPFVWQIVFILLLFFAIDLGQVLLPNFLEDVRGLTVDQIGLLGTLGSGGIVALTLLVSRMSTERRTSLVLAQVLALVAAVTWLVSGSFYLIGLAFFVHGSNRVARPIMMGRLARTLTPQLMSFGYGFQETAMRFGSAVAPWVAGILYAANPAYPLYGAIAALCLTLLLSWLLPSGLRIQRLPPGYCLHARVAAVQPALIIFDKDGTLIDFDAMWGGWLAGLARRLDVQTGLALTTELFALMEYDPQGGHINAQGRLAVAPMAELWQEIAGLLQRRGQTAAAAEETLAAVWQPPDPVELAYPLADLPALFSRLQKQGVKIAVATSDDREPALATLAGLGLRDWVDAVVAADDNLVSKPAPDMVLRLCRQLDVPASRAVVVGDTTADLQMGRAAGAGLVVGVRSGVSDDDLLTPYADLVLNSVADLFQQSE